MRYAVSLAILVLMSNSATGSAAETAAVYAHGKDEVGDDLLVKYRSVFAERLRTAGFLVIEIATLDGSVGRHGSYRVFRITVAGSGGRHLVKISEQDPRSLSEIDSVQVVAGGPAAFDRLLPRLLGTFIRGAAPANAPDSPEPAPPATVPEPARAAPAGPWRAAAPEVSRTVPGTLCMKEPGELYWGLGVIAGKVASGDSDGALGGMLRFAYEMPNVRFDIGLDGMGGGTTSFVEFGAAADYLFSQSNTAFYAGGGLAVMRIADNGGRHDLSGSGVGAGVQAGVEFLRHHSARFLTEARFVIPFFVLDDKDTSYDKYIPLALFSLQLLW